MIEEMNVYCDESCHLEHEKEKVMLVSCVWCKKSQVRVISEQLRGLKKQHGLSRFVELKWKKVSNSKIDYYCDLLDYFFNNKDLHFRTIIIPDKKLLNHEKFGQNHNIWYYKMIYQLVKYLLCYGSNFNIYVDKKENSFEAKHALKTTSECLNHLYNKNIYLQNIRSHESELMQLNDFIQGAVSYYNRGLYSLDKPIEGKVKIIDELINKYSVNLTETNNDDKFNILNWEASRGA